MKKLGVLPIQVNTKVATLSGDFEGVVDNVVIGSTGVREYIVKDSNGMKKKCTKDDLMAVSL